MGFLRKIVDVPRKWFGGAGSAAAPTAWMRVSNITRQTVLATHVEIADSGPKRNKGLLGRKGLDPGSGLWIVPCESVHTFAMKFPIDLLYLDRNLRIKKVQRAVPAWRFSACLSAHSVLELRSGAIDAAQTKAGDKLEFQPVETPGHAPNRGA